MKEDKIKDSVASFYKNVAENKKQVQVDSKNISASLGYSQEELASVPEEANMGLGCGNPQEKAQPKPGEQILDLGCGKGMDVFIAAKKVGDTGFVTGVDMTLSMIQVARKIAAKRKYENVAFRLGEIEHLPIPSNSMDLVMSNCVINLSVDKQACYDEVYRVLKEGGRIGISDTMLKKHLPKEVLEDPKMYGSCIAGASTYEELEAILRKAGFKNIDIETKEVSDEYAKKWGVEIDLKEYLMSAITTAYK